MGGILNREYGYDLVDNITNINDLVTSAKDQSFAYDPLNRLTNASGIYGQYDYTYDLVGNRISESIDNGSFNLHDAYFYSPTSNRLESISKSSSGVFTGTRSFLYNEIGSLTQDIYDNNVTRDYTYNKANRLDVVEVTGASVTSYTYNALGQRIGKANSGSVPDEAYHYDEKGQLIGVTDASGNPIREYIYNDDQLVGFIDVSTLTPTLYYVHNDHKATPQVVTSQTQQVVFMADYQPFGTLQDGQNNSIELYSRFPGQYFDTEARLYYNYFRDYDPSIGRYIQSDPIGLEGGINTYLYVDGNPFSGIDPFGLSKYQPKNTVEAWCIKYPTACREQEKYLYEQLRKKKKSNTSGKDGAKDCPSWAKEDGGPIQNEGGKDYAKRLLDEKYGPGNWGTGGGSEYSQIQKWADRAFE